MVMKKTRRENTNFAVNGWSYCRHEPVCFCPGTLTTSDTPQIPNSNVHPKTIECLPYPHYHSSGLSPQSRILLHSLATCPAVRRWSTRCQGQRPDVLFFLQRNEGLVELTSTGAEIRVWAVRQTTQYLTRPSASVMV